MQRYDVLIVGAGHGGAQAAILLRQFNFAGSIAVVSAEPNLPYERPPLSKDYLAGKKPFERLLIRPPHFWEQREISFRLGRSVTGVEPGRREVLLDSGERIGFENLVWAGGGSPRRLSCEGADQRQVFHIRSRSDVDRLTTRLTTARRVAVIGGGYIGLEAAAVLKELGKEVVVLEAAERILSRVTSEPVSAFFEAEHRKHGVSVETGVTITRLEAREDALDVRLADGRTVPADVVVVGIGIDPAIEPLQAAGAAAGSGVDVDEFCRTSLPGIFAIGDCAAHPNKFAGGARVRLESVQNARDQAAVAASFIVGDPVRYEAVPWFWSHQYDLKLQTVGLQAGYEEMTVRGDLASRSFSVVYCSSGKVIGLDCINSVKDFVQGKRLVESGAAIDPERVRDPSTPLLETVIA